MVLLGLAGVLLDFAVQCHQVMGQQEIYALRPDARARINTVYMGTVFISGAIASAVTGVLHDAYGWTGAAWFAAALPALGFVVWALRLRPSLSAPPHRGRARAGRGRCLSAVSRSGTSQPHRQGGRLAEDQPGDGRGCVQPQAGQVEHRRRAARVSSRARSIAMHTCGPRANASWARRFARVGSKRSGSREHGGVAVGGGERDADELAARGSSAPPSSTSRVA